MPLSSVPAEDARVPALSLRAVQRRFRTGWLSLSRRSGLAGVELSVAPGTTVALVGPNGSGKSTLLRLASGVDRPSAGEVRVFGRDPCAGGARSVRGRVAYLPDDSPFPGELSARSCLSLIGSLAGLERATVRRRGDALLERVGLGAEGGTALRGFSRGMLRRFGLAQAFLAEPDLVLLDEPTAGLDAPGFGVLADLCDEARGRGATLVLASHLLVDVEERCERMVVIEGGRVRADGAPRELLRGGGLIDLYRRLEEEPREHA